jgi:transposase
VTAQTVIAECGADLSVFPSEKQFTSWLGLVPTNDQSSGQILNRRIRKAVNRAATAFCNAATPLVYNHVAWLPSALRIIASGRLRLGVLDRKTRWSCSQPLIVRVSRHYRIASWKGWL